MRQALPDEAIQKFIAARESATVYRVAVTQIAQYLDCDVCFIVSMVDGSPVLQATSDDGRDYDTESTSLIRGIAREASTRSTVSVINDLTFTRGGTTSQSPSDTKRDPRTENTEAPIARDGPRAMASDSKQNVGAHPRSLLTVPVEGHGVVQAMDHDVGAFSEVDVEWVERLLSFAGPALTRLETDTPAHVDVEPNGGSVADSRTTATTDAELEFPIDPDSSSSRGAESSSATAPDTEQIANLVSGLTHDLKNPLGIAKGRLNLALENVADNDAATDELDHVVKALDRIERLVEEFETLQEGELVAGRQLVDLQDLARDCWELVPTGDATLQVEGSLQFEADPDAFSRLLENLFRNAVDHGGSEVTVRTGPLDAGGIYIEDDGVGLPEGERQQVFELGYSLSDTGAGKGLAIVKQVVEGHGWGIDVTEADTGGARFEITGVEVAP